MQAGKKAHQIRTYHVTLVPCLQDELLSKKKKEKKKKLSSRPAEELRCIGQDHADRYTCDIIIAGLPVCWVGCL